MGLFGKKNNDDNNEEEIKDISNLDGADLDAFIMSAIEETDQEQATLKEQARINEQERVARITKEREEEAKTKKAVVRRFFLMVTSAEDRADSTYGLKGNVYGEIKIADKIYPQGYKFSYHNHAHEFRDYKGKTVLKHILENTANKLPLNKSLTKKICTILY